MRWRDRIAVWLRAVEIERGEDYPTPWTLLLVPIVTLVTLSAYWFTSKALTPTIGSNLGGIDTNYFTFVLTGELALALPTLLLDSSSRFVRQSLAHGTLDPMLTLPIGRHLPFVIFSLAKLPNEILKLTLTIVLAFALFEFQVDPSRFASFALVQVAALPLFLGLGLAGSSILLAFGRGDRAIMFITNALTIFSGVYFPITVLPGPLRTAIENLSPFHPVLRLSREILSPETATGDLALDLVALLGVGLVVLAIGWCALGLCLKHRWKTGSNTLLRY